MALAVPSSNGNAATTCNRAAAAALLSPMLPKYRPSTPPLAEHCCVGELPIPTFCRRKGHPDDDATVDWASVRRACKEWLKNPMNLALLLWLLCVGVSGGMFVLLLLGLLFPAAAERKHWIEINVQVLNALFTLMSLYQHPALCHHLFLLCRWRPRDAADLRAAYGKGGERGHMAVVVALLHLTVVFQYVQCGLYWGYPVSARPELLADGFFVLGVVAPVAAAVYTVCSPLGNKDGQCHELSSSYDYEHTKQQQQQRIVVVEPEWAGGMFDCGDPSTWCLSLSCTFCVVGWNMQRLGFGNAYVHAVTFALLCLAPLWVLGVSALHIHDVVIGDVVGGAGVLLCACGLLYGGYWRIQMRKRFGLPGSTACCGSSSLTDYARWLLCWPWALAQEVRTANLYHAHGDLLYSKALAEDEDHSSKPLLLVIESSNNNDHDVFRATETVTVSQAAYSPPNGDHLVVVVEDETTTMAPPVQVVVAGDKPDESSVSVSEEDAASSLEETNQAVAEEDGHGMPSDASWRVERVKKLVNMVTLVSLLILLYTRGLIL